MPHDDYMTAADIATAYSTTVGAIRTRAYRHGWRRTKTRPVKYLTTDVVRTM